MGVTPTGMWDSSSYAAAGNLTADEAWEAFMNSGGDPILDDPSLTVDMQSVLSLGYGPISAEALAELEKRGEVERYLDGNLIKFRRTTSMPAPSRTVRDMMGGSLPINRIGL